MTSWRLLPNIGLLSLFPQDLFQMSSSSQMDKANGAEGEHVDEPHHAYVELSTTILSI